MRRDKRSLDRITVLLVENEAWVQICDEDYEQIWDQFEDRFGFRPGVDPSTWPAIREPSPSVTVDLSSIFEHEGARFAAGTNAVNTLGLYAFTCATTAAEELIVLDWQHPAYRFSPHRQALSAADWPVTIFPNGDYYAFLNEEMTAGTFGHPWEQSICVFGESLIELFGRPLAAALGSKRTR